MMGSLVAGIVALDAARASNGRALAAGEEAAKKKRKQDEALNLGNVYAQV